MWGDGCVNVMGKILSQCVHISNCHFLFFKYNFVNYTFIKLEKRFYGNRNCFTCCLRPTFDNIPGTWWKLVFIFPFLQLYFVIISRCPALNILFLCLHLFYFVYHFLAWGNLLQSFLSFHLLYVFTYWYCLAF